VSETVCGLIINILLLLFSIIAFPFFVTLTVVWIVTRDNTMNPYSLFIMSLIALGWVGIFVVCTTHTIKELRKERYRRSCVASLIATKQKEELK
jgi:uncharacterized membrane protein